MINEYIVCLSVCKGKKSMRKVWLYGMTRMRHYSTAKHIYAISFTTLMLHYYGSILTSISQIHYTGKQLWNQHMND